MAAQEVSASSQSQAPDMLRRLGAIGWAVVGVFLGIMAILIGFRAISGIVVPVVLALVLAVMTLPLTDWLDRFMPRGAAVAVVVLLVAAVAIGLAAIFIKGVADQVPAIQQSIQEGIAKIEDFFNIDPGSTTASSASKAGASASSVVSGLKGLTGFLVSSIDSMVSLFFGIFIGAMVFFLVLLNPQEAQGWVSRLLPWPEEQSKRLFDTSGRVIFDYYKGCTILAMVNALPIWIVALILDVKAAGAIFVVLFVSSYIPYIGAWIGGAFAVIMALGSGGTADGWIMLAAVLIVNLGLQSVIQPFAFGATMKVSPLGVFLFTLLGGLLGGVVGAMMAAPILALITRFNTDVRLPPRAEVAPLAVSDGDVAHAPGAG